jgi:hypothetical protein
MHSNINRRIWATFFVAAAALGAVATSVGGVSVLAPAFAQGGNMTDGGNTTEGRAPLPPPNTSGGMSSPPPPTMTP